MEVSPHSHRHNRIPFCLFLFPFLCFLLPSMFLPRGVAATLLSPLYLILLYLQTPLPSLPPNPLSEKGKTSKGSRVFSFPPFPDDSAVVLALVHTTHLCNKHF